MAHYCYMYLHENTIQVDAAEAKAGKAAAAAAAELAAAEAEAAASDTGAAKLEAAKVRVRDFQSLSSSSFPLCSSKLSCGV